MAIGGYSHSQIRWTRMLDRHVQYTYLHIYNIHTYMYRTYVRVCIFTLRLRLHTYVPELKWQQSNQSWKTTSNVTASHP